MSELPLAGEFQQPRPQSDIFNRQPHRLEQRDLLGSRPPGRAAREHIGQFVMEELRGLDQVAYVRFASVYRQFKDLDEFMKELRTVISGGPVSGPISGSDPT